MDANKLKGLRAIQYQIRPCCGLCQHGWFPQNDWGTCEVKTYEHEKHSGPRRHLSIHKYGSCASFKAKANRDFLGSFAEFCP